MSKLVVAVPRVEGSAGSVPRFKGSQGGFAPIGQLASRPFYRCAKSPRALAVGLMIASTLACGGSGPEYKAAITARVRSAPENYSAGDPFSVTITFENTGTVDVSQLRFEASGASVGVKITPDATLPTTLALGRSVDVTWMVSAGDVGPMTISFRAAGVGAGRSLPLEATAVVSLAQLTSIAAVAGANGSISPSGAVTVPYGGSQTFTITPAAGYRVADVLVDGASVGAVTAYTFNGVTASHAIEATFVIDTRTITASAGSNGGISPSGAVTVPYGGSQTFAITPAAGYRVADVLVDGVSVGAIPTYTFNGVTASHTIGATFSVDNQTISAVAGANGGISPSGTVTVPYGGSQTFTITPAVGYRVADVLVDGASVGAVTTYTFNGVTASHAIGATFSVDTRTIAAVAGANGSISPSGAVTVPYGGSQAFTITPAAHFHVADVLVDGGSVGAVTNYTFNGVTASHTIGATFAVDTRTLAAVASANGAISPSGTVTLPYGGSQTFTITPATHFHVADVLVDGVSVGAVTTYTFNNVTASHTIGAAFAVDTRTITAVAGANGSISPSGAVTVPYGGSQTLAITPAAHYHVADVLVDGVSVGAVTTYTFNNVTASHTIGAAFAVDTRTITASAGSYGSISPSGAVSVPYGGSQTFTITPDAGCSIADVIVDGAWPGAMSTYTFDNVVANHTIRALFSCTWGITATADTHGSITPSGTVTVGNGESQTFTIAPAAHYHVTDVMVDGVSVGPLTTYTFSGVTASHTIRASFAGDTQTIVASAGSHGSISPSGTVAVPYGGSQTFTMVAGSGYHVADVRVDGASVGATTRYTFSDVMASHSIEATFAFGAPPRAVFFGSSTTEGFGASDTAHRWTSLVAACFGWIEVNQGLGGSTMTMLDTSGTSAEARWPADVVAQQPDIVVIQYGANDITVLAPLGAPNQSGTFRHATQVVLGGISGALPSVPIYVIEPQPATALGANRGPYDAALAEGATAFDLPIVYASQAFPAGGQYAIDSLHLSDAGHSALARYVANSIAAIESWTMPACTF